MAMHIEPDGPDDVALVAPIRAREKRFSELAIADALSSTRGNITSAARRLGCNRETVRRAVAEYQSCRDAVARGRDERVDLAEVALDRALEAGEPWAVTLTLKTLGKARGYHERPEPADAENNIRHHFMVVPSATQHLHQIKLHVPGVDDDTPDPAGA